MKKILILLLPLILFMCTSNKKDTKRYIPKQIAQYSDDELLYYLTCNALNYHFKKYDYEIPFWDIQAELKKRNITNKIIDIYNSTVDLCQKESLIGILYHIKNNKVKKALKKTATTNINKITYYSHNYLAKQGDKKSIKMLNNNWHKYPVSSWQWSYTVNIFGKYKYKPAVPNMIKGLDSASGNMFDSCLTNLFKIYPDTRQKFNSVKEAKKFFNEYIKKQK